MSCKWLRIVSLIVLACALLAAPTATAQAPTAVWRGSYYPNRDLQGPAALVRDDANLAFRWAGASPGPNIPGDNWSARWQRTMNFPAGDYTFTAQVDDGVRLFVDNTPVINSWQEGSFRTVSGTLRGVRAGPHVVTVEYFQATGDSGIAVRADRAGQSAAPPLPPAPQPSAFPDWRGDYFNDIALQGAPLMTRNDPRIDFNWGIGSPDPRVPADNFSVRWTRRVNFDQSGDYVFSARTSDGVRIWLDGLLVMDEWRDTPEGEFKVYTARFYGLQAGDHNVRVEYYERGGIAYAMVWWNRYTGGGAPEE